MRTWIRCCAALFFGGFWCCYNSDLMLVLADSVWSEQETRHKASAIHAVGPCFNRGSRVKVKTDTSCHRRQVGFFADQGFVLWPLRLDRSKAGNRWQKRLFEHWLNISQSYKKQRGGYSWRERKPKSNPVHSWNLPFFSPQPFGGFLSPLCLCWLTVAVWFTKTSVTQMQTVIATRTAKTVSLEELYV